MGTQDRPGGGSRPWRTRLRTLLHELGADEWEEPAMSGPDEGDTHPGAQASLDQLLREASEARQSRARDDGAT
ncbi:MAG TPA: hypothetical protein VG244_11930 [Acidimicrobiales bacterium]|nr:hypothetical protein [Acidimicrobiales bacterium]